MCPNCDYGWSPTHHTDHLGNRLFEATTVCHGCGYTWSRRWQD